ncbi:winged helix-turn-helix transcriptional regulator [Spirosoma utsteinense]|uniref:DNA-binding HxlR family transcriptional regulator n=1 Tax=Spirosoma utsteinense TaxID=2585773 RepID=A0ABR6W226_9BACT|nr:helix-turn-helix domain-containing protein [Spirosoma utsteinense]MBC3785946.1 DNA-binding HxlR family transcriptional regulator [Spirosoma utsteinense]MBC3790644.1 DNA-binding HxlR family transcriptional regulator [Spirosoma utsteinense]
MSKIPETASPSVGGLRPSHSAADCSQSSQAVQDALYVLSGKWKLPIIVALSGGPRRFGELQRLVSGITAKMLSKELKELEMNEFAIRRVYATMPVTVEYELTEYSQSLNSIIEALRDWGIQHRARILGKDSVKA